MMRCILRTRPAALQFLVRWAVLVTVAAIPTIAAAGIVQLPQTGQKTCYDESGASISCSGTRQDGDLQVGLPSPAPRFIDTSDGTVTDNLTGLIWLKDAKCFPLQLWSDALVNVKTLSAGLCGLTDGSVVGDWRLPNILELESLVDISSTRPALPNGHPFLNMQSTGYWSSTTNAFHVNRARYVYFPNGAVNGAAKDVDLHFVWPVRGVRGAGQNSTSSLIQLPRTGQTTCWDTVGNVIPCTGTGQDAETLNGVEWPSPRFNDNGDGTLADRLTGLVWLKEANCFGSVPWQQGLDSANALGNGMCGLNDGSVAGQWRLPNRKELMSITNQNVSNGGAWLNSQGFVHGQHTYYWTSDTCLDYGVAYKWIVHPVGAAYPDSWNTPPGSRYVMLVRDPAQVRITAAVDGGHGTIASANPLTVACGSAAAFILTPDPGYQVNSTVSGSCQPGTFTSNTYDLGRATADCSVSFSFVQVASTSHAISTYTSGNGSIACTPSGAVAYNTDASCTVTPAVGNHVATVTVDGMNQKISDPASFSYSFPSMITDHAMFAAFAINQYTVSFIAGNNGSVTGSTTQTVDHGGSTTAVMAVPSTGYRFVNWTGDNGFVTTTANPLTLTNITGSMKAKANFRRGQQSPRPK